jgi:thiamine biosynthesis lipoprotein
VVAVLTAVALWMTRGSDPDRSHVALIRQPKGIMGTTTNLMAVVRRGREAVAQRGLDEAERELRQVDTLMSTYLEASEVSALNSAAAGELVVLSPAVREVLAAAHRVWGASDGAFDPTCRPLLELWREAGRRGRVPSPAELFDARRTSSWEDFEMVGEGVRKRRTGACVDLGGVAKGYGIDLAFETLVAAGCVGGLVDVGGDIRVGGHDDRGEPWTVTVRDPFEDRVLASFALAAGAVCTSGSYRRFTEIDDRRFSHIVDPRDGMPITGMASVTVVAADAVTADAWATALSVLGHDGLELLPPGIDALLVEGNQEDCSVHATPGVERLLGSLPDPSCRGD